MNNLTSIYADIEPLLPQFKEVREVNIHPLESKYFRDFDRLIIPQKQNNLLFFFIVAHELGHKHNNKALIWLFEATRLKIFQIALEYDAYRKSRHLIEDKYKKLYHEFSMDNFKSYLK